MSYTEWINAHKVAVMGAGTMGSGIAAHLANLGFDVFLFDLTEQSVRECFERATRAKPPHFFDAESISRVTLCSIQNDLAKIAEADWVCEAIIENLDAKRSLYEKIAPHLRESAMISTNTSGLQIELLCEGRTESFRRRFLGTHFFNPPRYLKLIELIPTPHTDDACISRMTQFLEDRAGRRVVLAKDTPGFIANRYGMWALFQAIHTAEKLGYSIEMTDSITGSFLGRPNTAVFRLADLIGLDIMEDIADNLMTRCEADPRSSVLKSPSIIRSLSESGFVGNKSGHGFYKREGSDFLVYEPTTGTYRPRREETIPHLKDLLKLPISERLKSAFETRGEVGEIVRLHLAPSLAYAVELGGQISHSVEDFDRVMKWGWGWAHGPFELIDMIGWDLIAPHAQGNAAPATTNYYVPGLHYSFDGAAHVSNKSDERFVAVSDLSIEKETDGWAIRSAGEYGYVFEFRTKANSITPALVEGLIEWLEAHPEEPITLANDSNSFSVGFDLKFFLQAAEEKQFTEVATVLERLQHCGSLLSRSKSCALVRGFVLGGGFELAAHCNTIVVQPESTLGLPEVLVGLIPAGGGTTLMRERTAPDRNSFVNAAVNIATGQRYGMPEARTAHYLRSTDRALVNPDQGLHTALRARREPIPESDWTDANAAASGMIDQKIQELRKKSELTSYGYELAEEIRRIFVKPKSRDESLAMERESFLKLLGKPMTTDRIKHLLETGKPLHN